MFERFKRSSGRANDGYENGPAFQRGDTYADGQGAPAATRVGDGRTGDGYAGDDRVGDGRVGDGRVGDGDGRIGDGDRTAVVERPAGTTTRGGAVPAATGATTGAATVAEAREIQRERFGGADGTAIFFGWLSALGLAALLLAVVGAAGTRLGFATDVDSSDATSNAGTIGIVGAAILVAILLLAYYSGGYVAGRMARFDGGRQGFRVWLLGLLVTIAAAVAGWIGGAQNNVFQQLNLPRIPVDEGDITTGAIITLAVVLIGTLLAAVAGGKAGDRYHARVDALAWDDDRGVCPPGARALRVPAGDSGQELADTKRTGAVPSEGRRVGSVTFAHSVDQFEQ